MYKDGKKILSICTAAMLSLTSSIVATKVSAAEIPEIDRIWGADRYQTAVKISQDGWKSGADCAIVASGEDYADALCSAPLAKAKDAPILLTKKNLLDENTLKELKRLKVNKVYIIGGKGSISKKVENKVKTVVKDIKRLHGKDRYETSVKIAEKLGGNNKIIVASGEGYADALSAAPVAAIKGIPVVLTKVNELPSTSKDFIKSTGATTTYVIGGTASVSDSVKKLVPGAERVYGKDRFETNVEVIKAFAIDFDFEDAYIALGVGSTGKEFGDALSVSSLASKKRAPVILTDKNLNKTTRELAEEKLYPTSRITIIGGVSNILDKTANAIQIKGEIIDNQKQIQDKTAEGNLAYTMKDGEIKDTNIKGNLYIENDNIVLSNVKVDGTIYINPGSKNTCKLENVTANRIIVISGREEGMNFISTKAKKLDILNRDNARIILEQNSEMEKTRVLSSTILQVEDGDLGNVIIPKTFNEKTVRFIGNFDKPIKVEDQAYLKADSNSTIKNVEVRSEKKDEVVLDGRFNDVDVYSDATIKIKEGTSALVQAKNDEAKDKATIYIPKNTEVKVRDYKEENIFGEGKYDALSEGTSGSRGGGGGSGSSSSSSYNPIPVKIEDICKSWNKQVEEDQQYAKYSKSNKKITVQMLNTKRDKKLSETYESKKNSLSADKLKKLMSDSQLNDIKINGKELSKYLASKASFEDYSKEGNLDYNAISNKLKESSLENLIEGIYKRFEGKKVDEPIKVIGDKGNLETLKEITVKGTSIKLKDGVTYKELRDTLKYINTYGDLKGEYTLKVENEKGNKTCIYTVEVKLVDKIDK